MENAVGTRPTTDTNKKNHVGHSVTHKTLHRPSHKHTTIKHTQLVLFHTRRAINTPPGAGGEPHTSSHQELLLLLCTRCVWSASACSNKNDSEQPGFVHRKLGHAWYSAAAVCSAGGMPYSATQLEQLNSLVDEAMTPPGTSSLSGRPQPWQYAFSENTDDAATMSTSSPSSCSLRNSGSSLLVECLSLSSSVVLDCASGNALDFCERRFEGAWRRRL